MHNCTYMHHVCSKSFVRAYPAVYFVTVPNFYQINTYYSFIDYLFTDVLLPWYKEVSTNNNILYILEQLFVGM